MPPEDDCTATPGLGSQPIPLGAPAPPPLPAGDSPGSVPCERLPVRWREMSLRHERRVGQGVLSLGAGYVDVDADGDLQSGVGEGLNGFVEWRQRWH